MRQVKVCLFIVGKMKTFLSSPTTFYLLQINLPTHTHGLQVFFDAFTPHRSARNMANVSRRNMYITYNLLDEGDHRLQYYADKLKNYPPDIERVPGVEYNYKI